MTLSGAPRGLAESRWSFQARVNTPSRWTAASSIHVLLDHAFCRKWRPGQLRKTLTGSSAGSVMARSKEQHGAAQDATHGLGWLGRLTEQHRTAPHCTGRPTTKNLGVALTPDRQKFPGLVQIYIDNSRRNVSLEVTVPQTFSHLISRVEPPSGTCDYGRGVSVNHK